MIRSATEIVSILDSPEDRLDVLRRITLAKEELPAKLRSVREFEETLVALIANRIVEANSRNEYSSKLEQGGGRDIRGRSKSLFERLVDFAASEPDPVTRKDLYLLLCYVKPESSAFVSRVAELREHLDFADNPVPREFIEYVLSMSSEAGAHVAGLSPAAHFASTTTVPLAGEQLPCRIAAVANRPIERVFCGCSATDSILFDTRRSEFDMFVTLPGLSLRHLTVGILTAIYESIIAPRVGLGAQGIAVTVCVGFVDRLKIAGAFNVWERRDLEETVDRLVLAAQASIKTANEAGGGRFHYQLYPGSFPVRDLDRVTVNGVVPFHSENDRVGDALDDRLRASSTATAGLFPCGKRLTAGALIHDREIHPRLGAALATIVRGD